MPHPRHSRRALQIQLTEVLLQPLAQQSSAPSMRRLGGIAPSSRERRRPATLPFPRYCERKHRQAAEPLLVPLVLEGHQGGESVLVSMPVPLLARSSTIIRVVSENPLARNGGQWSGLR